MAHTTKMAQKCDRKFLCRHKKYRQRPIKFNQSCCPLCSLSKNQLKKGPTGGNRTAIETDFLFCVICAAGRSLICVICAFCTRHTMYFYVDSTAGLQARLAEGSNVGSSELRYCVRFPSRKEEHVFLRRLRPDLCRLGDESGLLVL